jgi:hypothetical protein
LVEGELNASDPLSKIFFISDGLMTMLNDKYKIQFAHYISEVADKQEKAIQTASFDLGNEEPGLAIMLGIANMGVTADDLEKSLLAEIEKLKKDGITD